MKQSIAVGQMSLSSELNDAIDAIGGDPSTPESLALRRLCTLRPIPASCAWQIFSMPTHVSCCVTASVDHTVPNMDPHVECRVEAYSPDLPFRPILLIGTNATDVLRVGTYLADAIKAIEALTPHQRITRFLHLLGWIVHDVAHDGNCFFRVLSLGATGTQKHHAAFRHRLVTFMSSWPRLTDLVETPSEYIQTMAQTGSWGTEIEITAYADMCGGRVCVMSFGDERPCVYTYGQRGDAMLLYILHMNDHFLLLQPCQSSLPFDKQ